MRILLPLALAACSSSAPPVAKAPPTPAPPPAPAPDPMNLDFEQHDGDAPVGWKLSSPPGVDIASVADEHHGGARSLRLRSTPASAQFGAAAATIDAKPYVGKRVRLHGWVKTAEAMGASLFLRIDDGTGGADNLDRNRAKGTMGWTEQVAALDVLPGAEKLALGALLVGEGTAWFDDLRLEVVDVPKPHDIVIEGVVVDPAGAPVAGAEVGMISGNELVKHVVTDAAGAFRFAATSGHLGFSAHRKGAVGVFVDQQDFQADRRDLKLALAKDGGVLVKGTTSPKAAAGTYLQISPLSQHDADVFAVPVAADGTFEVAMPRGDQYNVEILEGPYQTSKVAPRNGDRVDVALALTVLGPPPAEVVDYIAKQGVALTTPEAGHGLDDMAPLGKLIGNARVVALGEATHGTREFFQIKHRFLEYLVAKQGFTVFAIEANQPECRAINDYVVDGKGDAKTALAGIYFWTWNTEEVLAMIEWMRAWNADPKHTAKVQFTGFDMQTSTVAAKNVDAFLREHAPDQADALLAPIAILAKAAVSELVEKQKPEERAAVTAGLAAVAKAFDANRKAWASPAYADVRHDVTVLQQAYTMYGSSNSIGGRDPNRVRSSYDVRDASMADNLMWLMEQQPKARFVVWAHNGHISNTLPAFENMGSYLRKRLGARYLNLGFIFGEGAFQAVDQSPQHRGLQEFSVGPPAESNVAVAFARTGKPLLVLDLRALPKRGPVHDWFVAPHPTREIGASFLNDKAMTGLLALPERFDGVIFVEKTTRARPVKKP